MQAQTNYAAIFSCITMIIVAIIAVSMLIAPAPTEPASAEEIAAATAANILLNIEVPSADEIANAIDMPDTKLSVEDYEKQLAEELALDEMNSRDFKTDLAIFLDNASEDVEEIDRHDIVSYTIIDVDVDLKRHEDNADVKVEFKVIFDNYGDESETARVKVTFDITDLDRDNDYEDAEVDGYSLFSLVKFYGDIETV